MDTALIEKIEAQRVELEANIAKLRKSLHHWTALELDYEGLKDEFQALRIDASKVDCLKVAHDFAPQKVDEKELNQLIEPGRGKTRSPVQIAGLLSKRIDYVSRNTESLKKQISDLEKKRNAVLLAAHPEYEAEAVLPLAEITEELDKNGNVLSSNVQTHGDTAKKVLDVLQKTKVPPAEGSSLEEDSWKLSHRRIEELGSSEEDSDELLENRAALDDRTTETYPTNSDDNEEEAEIRQEMINYGLGEVGNIVAELELADAESQSLNDEGGMEEDIDIDDGLDDGQYDDSDASMEDESEDESGRLRKSAHTDKYRDRMQALQKQLGLEMENVGPSPETIADSNVNGQVNYMRDSEFNEQMEHLPPEFRKRFGRPSPAQAAREAAIAREEASRSAGKEARMENTKSARPVKGKKVAFAPTVDIAPASSITKPAMINDTITEHLATNIPPPEPAPPAKVSRFRAARSSQSQTPVLPSQVETSSLKQDDRPAHAGKTIARDLVERPGTISTKEAPPPDADDFDEELQRRQIALEHQRLHNKMIHEQGGYVRGGESENWGDAYKVPSIVDERTGEPVKISRFKAARLKP